LVKHKKLAYYTFKGQGAPDKGKMTPTN